MAHSRDAVHAASERAGDWPSWPLPAITVEVAGYGVLILAGLALRLFMLGAWPLLESELPTALAAWRALHGVRGQPPAYSPLLYDADLILFFFTRASDATARLLPACAGALLIAMPYFARRLLERVGAMATAALLAGSPAWVYFSRTADGAILTTLAGAVLLYSTHRFTLSGEPRDFRPGAVALGLGLAAGPGIYTLLVAALGFGVCASLLGGSERRQRWARLVRTAASRNNLLVFAGVFLLAASGFLTNPSGIWASVRMVAHWAVGLAPARDALPWYATLHALLNTEFLTVGLALVGMGQAFRRRQIFDAFLLFWFLIALCLGVLLGHREPYWLPDVLLPLVILAGRGAQRLWERWLAGATRQDGLALGLALIPLGFAFLGLVSYLNPGAQALPLGVYAGWSLIVVVGCVYLLWSRPDAMPRLAIGILGVIALCLTVRATTSIGYLAGRDPRQPLLEDPTSVQVREFESFVRLLSSRQIGDSYLLDMAYDELLDPWLGWYLRDFPNAFPVSDVHELEPALPVVVITRPLLETEYPEGYVGQRFRLTETWSDAGLSLRERIAWFVYRRPAGAEDATELQVWTRIPGRE